jgi:hypothetical protein
MIDNKYNVTYDNVGQVFKNAKDLNTRISLSQASASTNLNVSFNRNYQPGTNIVARPFTRQVFRANIDHTFRDNLTAAVTAEHSRINQNPDQLSYTDLWRLDPDINLLAKNDNGSP